MSSFLIRWHKVFCSCPRIYSVDLCNHYHSHSVSYAKFNAAQQARLAQKYLIKDQNFWRKRLKKKKSNNDQNKMLVSSIFGGAKEENDFRLRRLNVVFLEKVTDVLATSEYYSEILEKGFEITKIRVQPGFSVVHAYWYSKFEYLEELGNFVSTLAKYMRYELTCHRVLGRIPPFLFIRDDTVHTVAEIDKRLKIADFGPDYKPIYFRPEISQAVPLIQKQLSPQTWQNLDVKSQELETKEQSSDPLDAEQETPSDISTIRSDIFGVKREKIMSMVKKGCKTSREPHRTLKEENLSSISQADSKSQPTSEEEHLSLNSQAESKSQPSYLHYANIAHARTAEIKKWVKKHKRLSKVKVKNEEIRFDKLNLQDDEGEDLEDERHSDYSDDEDWESDYSNDFEDSESYHNNNDKNVFKDK